MPHSTCRQKYSQSKVHPRYLYLVLADIIDDDSQLDGIDIQVSRKRHAAYFRTKDGQPMDSYAQSYRFMTREFSDVTGEEAESYLLEDHMQTASEIISPDPIPTPREQAALLQEAHPKRDDLILDATLFARLYTNSNHQSHAYWRDVLNLLALLTQAGYVLICPKVILNFR